MSGWHIAQLNVGRILAPTDSPQLAEFMAALDEINARAEATPGFIWRLQSDSGNATDIRVSEDPSFLVNMSVWATIESLFDFVYRSAHTAVMARRRQWFEKPTAAYQVRSEEHTSELQSPCNLVCRLLLEKKNQYTAVYLNA